MNYPSSVSMMPDMSKAGMLGRQIMMVLCFESGGCAQKREAEEWKELL